MIDFTEEQRLKIARAISAGREALGTSPGEPLTFAHTFIAAGGLCVPGVDASEDRLSIIGSDVLRSIEGQQGPLCSLPVDDEEGFDTVMREMLRALMETHMADARSIADVAGFRLVYFENVADREGCERYRRTIDFGLGLGVFPVDAVVVLPPCCDRGGLEVVFSDEINPEG